MSEHLFVYGTLLPSEAPKEIASIVKRCRRLRGQVTFVEDFTILENFQVQYSILPHEL